MPAGTLSAYQFIPKVLDVGTVGVLPGAFGFPFIGTKLNHGKPQTVPTLINCWPKLASCMHSGSSVLHAAIQIMNRPSESQVVKEDSWL